MHEPESVAGLLQLRLERPEGLQDLRSHVRALRVRFLSRRTYPVNITRNHKIEVMRWRFLEADATGDVGSAWAREILRFKLISFVI